MLDVFQAWVRRTRFWRSESYSRITKFVRRSASVPVRRFLGGLRRVFMQRGSSWHADRPFNVRTPSMSCNNYVMPTLQTKRPYVDLRIAPTSNMHGRHPMPLNPLLFPKKIQTVLPVTQQRQPTDASKWRIAP
jgi:hypothetical protein